MTIFLILLSLLLCTVGILGCIVPGLPGHPLNYLAMWCIQWAFHPFSTTTLFVWGVFTLIVLILDYLIPLWTAKKYGATRRGIIGSLLGMAVGFFFTPVGMIIGTIAGAIIGDLLAGKSHTQATRSGLATFFGTLISTGMKLLLSGIMTGLIIYKLFGYLTS